MAKESVDQVVDDSWELIEQVIHTGKFRPKDSEAELTLEPDDIIALAMKLSAHKLSKPRGVSTPEDFKPKKTSHGEEEA